MLIAMIIPFTPPNTHTVSLQNPSRDNLYYIRIESHSLMTYMYTDSVFPMEWKFPFSSQEHQFWVFHIIMFE